MSDKGDKGDKGHVQGTDQGRRSRGSKAAAPMYQTFPKEKAKFTAQEALNIKPIGYEKPPSTSDIKLKNITPDVDLRTQSPLKMFFDEDPNYRPPCSSQPESETESEFEFRHGSRSQPQYQPQSQYPSSYQPYQLPPNYQPQSQPESQPQSQYPSSYQPYQLPPNYQSQYQPQYEYPSQSQSQSQPLYLYPPQSQPEYQYSPQTQPQSQYPTSYLPPSDVPLYTPSVSSRNVQFPPGTSTERPLSIPQDPPVGIPGRPITERFQEDIPEKMEVPPSTSGEDTGGSQLGRGAMRGRRVLPSELVTRPENLVTKRGASGTEMLMQTNYFKLVTTTDWCLYQYRVDFFPEEDRTPIRKGLLKSHKDTLGPYVFDGTVLYSNRRMEQLEVWSKRISDGVDIKIVLRFVGDMRRGDHNYLQFFNIIMRRCLELLKLQIVGRDYYDANDKIDVQGHRMELWPGYLTSIRQHENGILMCAEITHKVMRQQTVLDILNECFRKDNDNYKKEFESLVLGLVVLTDYNNHTYRISDIDYDVGPDSTFLLKNGDPITYRDYYKSKYRIMIRENCQPLLITRARPRDRRSGQCELIYLVPELCRATGLTDKMRENFGLMRSLAEFTRVSPDSRMKKLMDFNSRLRSEPAIITELDQWNLKLADRLLDIPARVLDAELIILGNQCVVSAGKSADWTRQLHNKPLYNPRKLKLWVTVYANKIKDEVQNFVHLIKNAASGMGSSISFPRYYEITDERSNAYSEFLERVLSKVNPELVLCVVPNNRSDRYSAIKKKCIVDRHTPSQVFLEKNLTNKNVRTIATKVAIQMNCKLGGSPWSVDLPDIDLMVIGFDVCHDTSNKSRDYGAMVASLDRGLTRYYSVTSAHNVGQELSNKFGTNLDSALKAYRKANLKFPSFIVFYRDGVGEGQVPYVLDHEVGQIQDKLKTIYNASGVLVKFAFLIVTKRINTRIFREKNNPPPGTIIDDIVTNPLRYDFFIVSQSVRQGTVTPCAYHVIADTTGWSPDQMQRLTYKLCHMYYNWSGTVRVPAPCQYAHKLAFLVAQFLRHDPSHHMEEILYYL